MTTVAPPADADVSRSSDRTPVAATRSRRLVGLLPCLAVLGVLVLASVAVGSKYLPLDVVVSALREDTGRGDSYVVWDLRMPRTVVAAAVGIALGVAGALVQALSRNPLADPGILGVNAGAAFSVAIGITVFGVTSIGHYVWFAFAGALVVTVVVYLIGSAGRGGVDPVQLVLAGVALGAVLDGLVTAIKLTDPDAFDAIRSWNAGSVVGRDWEAFVPVLPFLVVGLVLACLVAPSLNAVALGDDLARSLGTDIAGVRVVVIAAVTLLAGGATAVVGPIILLGLMVPHVARWIVGPDQRWILAYTIVLGPSLMLLADLIGRVAIRPAELPVGVVTAFVGAPVLVVLVRRRRASGL